MLGLLFALGAAVFYAALDLLRKKLADRLDAVSLLAWMTLLPIPAFGAWAALANAGLPADGYWLPGLGSAALNVGANLCFLVSVRTAGLGSTIPLLALTPVFTSLLGIPLLGEVPGPLQGLGIALVVAGAFWLYRAGAPRTIASKGGGAERAGERAAERGGAERGAPQATSSNGTVAERDHALGMALMVVVAVCWSAATPLDRLALRSTDPAFHALVLHTVIAVAMLVLLARRRRLRRLADARPFAGWLLLTVTVSAVALTCQLYALQHLWAGLVETVKRGLGSGSALLAGALLLGEAVTAAKVAAVAVTVVGVSLVLL